jgi:PAT family beta-lactamase induction signal transducer AmpG
MIFFLSMTTPQYWLKECGVSLKHIGLFGLVSFPYVLKVLWAPLIDLISIPWLTKKIGHRRSWLVLVHVCLAINLIMMGLSNPAENFFMACFWAFGLAFLGATQDVLVDAYRIEVLSKDESAPGVSMLIFGYRIGALLAKAGTLHLAAAFSWTVAYSVMAIFVAIGICATLLNPEPNRPSINKRILFHTRVLLPFREFIQRSIWWWVVFLFIILYRLPDAMLNSMAGAFYVELGFTKPQIANVNYIFGTAATILGGFLGGFLIQRISILKGLFVSGVLHTACNLMYVVLSFVGDDMMTFYISIALENITSGMCTVAFIGYLSRLCQRQYALAQFALVSSLWSLSTTIASFSGHLVEEYLQHDWDKFFYISGLAAIPGLLLIFFLSRYPYGSHTWEKG